MVLSLLVLLLALVLALALALVVVLQLVVVVVVVDNHKDRQPPMDNDNLDDNSDDADNNSVDAGGMDSTPAWFRWPPKILACEVLATDDWLPVGAPLLHS